MEIQQKIGGQWITKYVCEHCKKTFYESEALHAIINQGIIEGDTVGMFCPFCHEYTKGIVTQEGE